MTSNNSVYFVNGESGEETAGFVIDGASDFLLVTVPSGAVSGTVYVANGSGVSNPLPFVVLVEDSLPDEGVIGRVGTGAPVRAVAVTPDGAMAYALSPEADVVVPIDLNTLQARPREVRAAEMMRGYGIDVPSTLVVDGEGVITEVLGPRGKPGVDTLSIIREMNLPAYWEVHGLPESCRHEGERYLCETPADRMRETP